MTGKNEKLVNKIPGDYQYATRVQIRRRADSALSAINLVQRWTLEDMFAEVTGMAWGRYQNIITEDPRVVSSRLMHSYGKSVNFQYGGSWLSFTKGNVYSSTPGLNMDDEVAMRLYGERVVDLIDAANFAVGCVDLTVSELNFLSEDLLHLVQQAATTLPSNIKFKAPGRVRSPSPKLQQSYFRAQKMHDTFLDLIAAPQTVADPVRLGEWQRTFQFAG